ncbi:MAG: oxidoreductase [Herpetosiphonaceae bacterium]|nr:MAG: oxidoreductase [Herpetosiphonaceae bacterium]
MEQRQLGMSDLRITPIGFGAWALGGGNWSYGWGDQDDRESIAAIHRAIDLGINWIDTAPAYGLGHSETVIGKALKGLQHRPYIFTKCSMVWDAAGELSGNLKAASVRREVEDSLRRLQVDVIDLYQIHWPDPDADIEEGWETLAQLQAEGKVRYIGVSNFSVDQMNRIRKIAPITSLQPPYSLINRSIEDENLPYCREHHIGVIVYSPMQSGLLSGKMTRERAASLPENDWRSREPDFQEPLLSRHLRLVDQLRHIAERHGRSVGEVAIAWTLRDPVVTGAIVGFRSPRQVEELIGAATFRLSPEDLAELDAWIKANPA